LRFANFDSRLTAWVDRDLPFGDGQAYDPPELRRPEDKTIEDVLARRGPTENDLRPASICSKGAHVKISHLKLWRDTYYTAVIQDGDFHIPNAPAFEDREKHRAFMYEFWSDPAQWDRMRKPQSTTMYVQPGHYLCLGDNSQASSDSRDWGTVPARLMLGRALVVYFPFDRIGPIH
jgi:signal peptidase I